MSIPTVARSGFASSEGDDPASGTKRDFMESLFTFSCTLAQGSPATAFDEIPAYFTASKVSKVALSASLSTSCLPLIWKLATFSRVCK